ncbi:hypothetical protein PSHT_04544 [Puccinia striiformis]|nr:hypothetical protein PSTT_05077 [Puccinia striiformis]POW15617.1 hypothetical protein PSTT_01879 [Puccinia striiformis]POW19510.1 hypothetical protein PSHT_04544 [Puccinia striiformis]
MPSGQSHVHHLTQAPEYYSDIYGVTPYLDNGHYDHQPLTYATYWDPTLAPSYPYGRTVAVSGRTLKTDSPPPAGGHHQDLVSPGGIYFAVDPLQSTRSANPLNPQAK